MLPASRHFSDFSSREVCRNQRATFKWNQCHVFSREWILQLWDMNFGVKKKGRELTEEEIGRGDRWVGGKLWELYFFYLSSHFWLGYAPWGVRWAGWGWRPGADWQGRAWRCAGGCVGAGACAGVGETRPSGVTRGPVVRRTAPCPALNSEPGNGCSAPASGGHALQERRARKTKKKKKKVKKKRGSGRGGWGGHKKKKRHERPVSLHIKGRRRKKIVTWHSLFLQLMLWGFSTWGLIGGGKRVACDNVPIRIPEWGWQYMIGWLNDINRLVSKDKREPRVIPAENTHTLALE